MAADQDPALAAYRSGTDLLRRGRMQDAARRLEETAADARTWDHELALGKVLLELGRWDDAVACLEPLTESPPPDTGTHAYVHLLIAAGLAGGGRSAESASHLDEVTALDPRLERASRALARRIAEGQAPLVRL